MLSFLESSLKPNRRDGQLMNKKQIFTWIVLMAGSAYVLQNVQNGVFGLLDNGPMLLLMLMGLDPDGWLGTRLAKYDIHPAYLACGAAMFVNTTTDGIAGLGDTDASFLGVVVGCLIPITFLPIIWMLRNRPDQGNSPGQTAYLNAKKNIEPPTTYSCPWRTQ